MTDSSSARPEDVRLDPELAEYIKRRQRQNAPLCPKCGRRKIEVAETGWCHPCSIDHRERGLAFRQRWWKRNSAGTCELCGGREFKDIRRHVRRVHADRRNGR